MPAAAGRGEGGDAAGDFTQQPVLSQAALDGMRSAYIDEPGYGATAPHYNEPASNMYTAEWGYSSSHAARAAPGEGTWRGGHHDDSNMTPAGTTLAAQLPQSYNADAAATPAVIAAVKRGFVPIGALQIDGDAVTLGPLMPAPQQPQQPQQWQQLQAQQPGLAARQPPAAGWSQQPQRWPDDDAEQHSNPAAAAAAPSNHAWSDAGAQGAARGAGPAESVTTSSIQQPAGMHTTWPQPQSADRISVGGRRRGSSGDRLQV